jgi:V/A-type H+/Na+-transporting ATPase subunit D
MELLRLRKRLQLAERGHKLLKDKLEEIMRRFLEIMRELTRLQEGVGEKMNKIFLSFALVRARNSRPDLDDLIPAGELVLSTQRERIFNVAVPRFSLEILETAEYDLLNTEAELDIGIKNMRALLEDLMEIARLWKAVESLSREIEITRRRVNALEHILIPNIKETIRYISGRLEEMERSFQTQLMRVKEIVGEH